MTERIMQPWWRCLPRRLSLRMFLLLVLSLGGGLGWFERSVKLQRQAVATLESRGAQIVYSWDASLPFYTGHGGRVPDPWLLSKSRSWLGIDRIDHPSNLNWRDADLDEESTEAILRLDRLRSLDLSGQSLTDDKLSILANGLPLEELTITASPMTDAGLVHLGRLKKLRSLNLESLSIQGGGFDELAGLLFLTEVSTENILLHDEALVHLGKLTHLKRLKLEDSLITNRGIFQLSSLTNLRELDLTGTLVTMSGALELYRIRPNLSIRGRTYFIGHD